MKKTILSLATLSMLSIPSVGHANGAAMCIAQEKNSNNVFIDKEYFIRLSSNDSTSGDDVYKAAREDFRKKYDHTPSCRDSGNKFLNGGHYVIIEGGRKKDYSDARYHRWAIGFGATYDEAIKDGLKHLSRRDWSWAEEKHDYKVEDIGKF